MFGSTKNQPPWFFGSSWHLVSGPTTAISIAVFASVSPYAPPGSPERYCGGDTPTKCKYIPRLTFSPVRLNLNHYEIETEKA
jgi:hypothetical protein